MKLNNKIVGILACVIALGLAPMTAWADKDKDDDDDDDRHHSLT